MTASPPVALLGTASTSETFQQLVDYIRHIEMFIECYPADHKFAMNRSDLRGITTNTTPRNRSVLHAMLDLSYPANNHHLLLLAKYARKFMSSGVPPQANDIHNAIHKHQHHIGTPESILLCLFYEVTAIDALQTIFGDPENIGRPDGQRLG